MVATSFVGFTREWTPTGGRLERGDLDSGEGLRLHRRAWRDPEFDSACSFTEASDGELRCLPSVTSFGTGAVVVTRYTDPDCATPVEVGLRDLACFDEAPMVARYVVCQPFVPRVWSERSLLPVRMDGGSASAATSSPVGSGASSTIQAPVELAT